MLRIARSHDGRLALGLLYGRFDPLQVIREVDRAYRMGDLAPGLSSVIVYDPGLQVDHVSVADLCAIRDCVARNEAARPLRAGTFLGLFVAAEREAQIVANVYAATWKGAAAPPPQHAVAASIAEAEARLGVGPLAGQIAALRPPPGLRYLA